MGDLGGEGGERADEHDADVAELAPALAEGAGPLGFVLGEFFPDFDGLMGGHALFDKVGGDVSGHEVPR